MNLELEENGKITVVYDKTASHNVDPQKGFTPLCPNELPVPNGDNIVNELNGQNNLAKYKTVSKDMHPANAIWLANAGKPQYSPVEGCRNCINNRICVMGCIHLYMGVVYHIAHLYSTL